MSSSQEEPQAKARHARDPYEAYFRYEQRQQRIQTAIVVGSVLILMGILGTAIYWHLEDARIPDAQTRTASLR